VLEGT